MTTVAQLRDALNAVDRDGEHIISDDAIVMIPARNHKMEPATISVEDAFKTNDGIADSYYESLGEDSKLNPDDELVKVVLVR